MIENGYVRAYRSLLKWEWYQDTNTKVVFLHLLLTVNYEDQKWKGIVVKRGQRISSYQRIATELNLSVKNVRTALSHLISTGEVAHKATSAYGVFTVVNYDKYQSMADDLADEGQSGGSQEAVWRQSSGNKERKIIKQENKKARNIYTAAVPLDASVSPESQKRAIKHQYGEYGNVLLTDEEYTKLKNQFPKDWQRRVSELDIYIGSKGAKYKSHYMTIIAWAKKSGDIQTAKKPEQEYTEDELTLRAELMK